MIAKKAKLKGYQGGRQEDLIIPRLKRDSIPVIDHSIM